MGWFVNECPKWVAMVRLHLEPYISRHVDLHNKEKHIAQQFTCISLNLGAVVGFECGRCSPVFPEVLLPG